MTFILTALHRVQFLIFWDPSFSLNNRKHDYHGMLIPVNPNHHEAFHFAN